MTSERDGAGNYDWSVFMAQSAVKYRRAATSGDITGLEHHNLVTGIDQEILFMQALCRRWPGPGARALDVCCGGGFLAEGLVRAGFDVSAFDLDENAILYARRRFPGINFLSGNALTPREIGVHGRFDLIVMREVHPLTRVGDFDFNWRFVQTYLDMLTDKGALVIAHAPPPDGPSVDMGRLRSACETKGFRFRGPYYYPLYKRLGRGSRNAAVIILLSWAAGLMNIFLRRRWIRYVVIGR